MGDTTSCPYCHGTGWIYDKKTNTAWPCSCLKIIAAKRRLERSGISKEFQRMNFDNYYTDGIEALENAKTTAMNYVKHFSERRSDRHNSIMFMGQVGAGKTHLGIAICSALMQKEVPVTYMAYRNDMTMIKQSIGDMENYQKSMERFRSAALLYIDDFQKGKTTETDVNVMYEIINYRYMNALPLIISTEKSLDDILAFDEAIGSRIIEMCRGCIVYFTGRELNYRIFGEERRVG